MKRGYDKGIKGHSGFIKKQNVPLSLLFPSCKEVLREMVGVPALRMIPVAILTTSNSESHLCDAHPKGRCQYFIKTAEFAELQGIVRQIVFHARAAAA
jgi:hypothetical protein